MPIRADFRPVEAILEGRRDERAGAGLDSAFFVALGPASGAESVGWLGTQEASPAASRNGINELRR
jgi:hypothetical protein